MVTTIFSKHQDEWQLQPSVGSSTIVRNVYMHREGVNLASLRYLQPGPGLRITGLPGYGIAISINADASTGIYTDDAGRLSIDPVMLESKVTSVVDQVIDSGVVVTVDKAQEIVTTIIAEAGYSKIAVKPFGFTLDSMDDSVEDELSIQIPGFVFLVTSDLTGVVICNMRHNDDGSTTIVFTDPTYEEDGTEETFTAYAFINSDGSVIPMLSKTNL